MSDLFRACQLVLGRRGHTAVIIDPPSGPYLDYGRDLIPAADAAGMDYLQHIIAVLVPDETGAPAAPLPGGNDPSGPADEVHIRVHIEMLIFILGGPPASSTDSADLHQGPTGGSPRSRRSVRGRSV